MGVSVVFVPPTENARLVGVLRTRPGAASGKQDNFHVSLGEYIMKHVHCVTRPTVTRAQTSMNTILNILGTVLSSVGALLLTVAPLLSKGGR